LEKNRYGGPCHIKYFSNALRVLHLVLVSHVIEKPPCFQESHASSFFLNIQMALAGWCPVYISPSDDTVQCIYCEKSVGGFEKGDDPIEEHRRRVPNCPFFNYNVVLPRKESKSKNAASQEALGIGWSSENAIVKTGSGSGSNILGVSGSKQSQHEEENMEQSKKVVKKASKASKKKAQELEPEDEESEQVSPLFCARSCANLCEKPPPSLSSIASSRSQPLVRSRSKQSTQEVDLSDVQESKRGRSKKPKQDDEVEEKPKKSKKGLAKSSSKATINTIASYPTDMDTDFDTGEDRAWQSQVSLDYF
jgi:hypothetical protein